MSEQDGDRELEGSTAKEFTEILHDLGEDLRGQVPDFDPDLAEVFDRSAITTLNAFDGHKLVRALRDGYMWAFLIGREHHARGYRPPFRRSAGPSQAPSDIPDDLSGL